jgi:hypothetical protein
MADNKQFNRGPTLGIKVIVQFSYRLIETVFPDDVFLPVDKISLQHAICVGICSHPESICLAGSSIVCQSLLR